MLTRLEGKSLTIGDCIVVTVLKLRAGDVSIGIVAPREVPIVRTELLESGVGINLHKSLNPASICNEG